MSTRAVIEDNDTDETVIYYEGGIDVVWVEMGTERRAFSIRTARHLARVLRAMADEAKADSDEAIEFNDWLYKRD